MTLNTVKRRLEAQQSLSYHTPAEFVLDIRLIFRDCVVLSEVLENTHWKQAIFCFPWQRVQLYELFLLSLFSRLCLHCRMIPRCTWQAGSLRSCLKSTSRSSTLTRPSLKSKWKWYLLLPVNALPLITKWSLQSDGAHAQTPRIRRGSNKAQVLFIIDILYNLC